MEDIRVHFIHGTTNFEIDLVTKTRGGTRSQFINQTSCNARGPLRLVCDCVTRGLKWKISLCPWILRWIMEFWRWVNFSQRFLTSSRGLSRLKCHLTLYLASTILDWTLIITPDWMLMDCKHSWISSIWWKKIIKWTIVLKYNFLPYLNEICDWHGSVKKLWTRYWRIKISVEDK